MINSVVQIVGAPGSGKDTICKRLRGLVPDFDLLIMSEELMAAARGGHEWADTIRYNMENSLLVPDNVVNDVMFKAIRARRSGKDPVNLVLNGVPRSRLQALEVFNATPGKGVGGKPLFSIIFETHPDICIDRLKNRPGRPDSDTPEKIAKRLVAHNKHWRDITAYLIAWNKGHFVINEQAPRSVDDKLEEVVQALRNFGILVSDPVMETT